MKLTVLTDNYTYTGKYCYGEPGFSCYIEDGEHRILFDTGYSDIFLKNARTLGLDLSGVTTVVLSHGHNDHTGGLTHFARQYGMSDVSLVAHPGVLDRREIDGRPAGIGFTQSQLEVMCKLVLTREPVRISDNIAFLGGIPQLCDFEKRSAVGQRETQSGMAPDYVLDDSALVYRGQDGIFVITGCAHSGICNIVEYAKQICHDDRVLGVLGGFHMPKLDDRARAASEYLVGQDIRALCPCHCVGFDAKAYMNSFRPIREVGVGFAIEA